jgi:hypothetical protein
MAGPDPFDDTSADHEQLEAELLVQDRDAASVATTDIDEATARRLVGDLLEDDVVTPIPDQRILVHEPSSKPFESITQLAVFHRGWQAATDADAEDN